MRQTWDILEEALKSISYERDPVPDPKRRFRLTRDDASNIAILYIYTYNTNTYQPTEMRHTQHEFVVPLATYNKSAWVRWVFDRIMSIEMHETCEWFFVDGERIYAPHHGNGWDPYSFWPAHDYNEKFKAPGEE